MSDTTAAEMPAQVAEELVKIASTTKRGFDLQARLKGRGLRKATITIYLDEEKGPELGWAKDIRNALDEVVGREREGVMGEIDALLEEKNKMIASHDEQRAAASVLEDKPSAKELKAAEEKMANLVSMFNEPMDELEKKRDVLVAELTKTALVIRLRAVPPVIQKDCRRKAKLTLGIDTKGIPEELEEEFFLANTAHLMTVIFQSITDNESGEVNTEFTYQDAIDLMGYVPPAQFARLDMMMGQVQYMDAISLSIEGQEDFS